MSPSVSESGPPEDGGRPRSLKRHARTALLVLGALVASVALVGVGMNLWVRLKATGHIHEEAAELPQMALAIVPGAAVYADGRPSHALADRLEAALALYRAGKVQRILVSGLQESPYYDEVTAMTRWLREHGVPDAAVTQDGQGFRTLDTMARAAKVFGVSEAIICTQRFHLPRAIFLGQQAGIESVGLVADRRTYSDRLYNWAREFLARIRAFLDVYVLNTQPASLKAVSVEAEP